MSKFRFREYDALGLQKRVPGDKVLSAHHISKRKQKQKDVEVVFDVKDYKEYVTGFRKRKQQRRQDAAKQIKEKQRLERSQQRSEKRTKLKEELGLGDDYGVGSSSDDDEQKDAQPQSVTVYRGEGGLTTTVTTMALQSSEAEQSEEPCSSEGEDADASYGDGDGNRRGQAAGTGPSSGRRGTLNERNNGGGMKPRSKNGTGREQASSRYTAKQGGCNKSLHLTARGGVGKAGEKGAGRKRHK